MAKLIDSNIFIELERRGKPLSFMLDFGVAAETVAISAITALELIAGVH